MPFLGYPLRQSHGAGLRKRHVGAIWGQDARTRHPIEFAVLPGTPSVVFMRQSCNKAEKLAINDSGGI